MAIMDCARDEWSIAKLGLPDGRLRHHAVSQTRNGGVTKADTNWQQIAGQRAHDRVDLGEIARFRQRLTSRPTNKKRSPAIGLLEVHFKVEFAIGDFD
jgi:hypothetical protein